jgi:hypothetical protein
MPPVAVSELGDALQYIALIALFHRGAHATGLLFVAPLFAVADAPIVFAGLAFAIPLGAPAGTLALSRAGEARGRATGRIRQS